MGDTPALDTVSTMLLDMPVSLPLPLSLLSEDFTLELDVISLTLLEPFMSPRGRLRLMLMPTTLLDTVLDTPDWDTLDWDTLVSDMLVSDTPVLDTMLLLDTLTFLPLAL